MNVCVRNNFHSVVFAPHLSADLEQVEPGFSLCAAHTHPTCAWTHNQVLTHNLDLFPQKLEVKGGSRGDKGGGQRWQEERGVEFENRVKVGHREPDILYRA